MVYECAYLIAKLLRSNQPGLYVAEKAPLLVVAEVLAGIVDTELLECLNTVFPFDIKDDTAEIKKQIAYHMAIIASILYTIYYFYSIHYLDVVDCLLRQRYEYSLYLCF